MSDSWIIVSGRRITLDGLRSQIEAAGGRWVQSEQGPEWGVLEDEDAAIYVNHESDYARELEPEDLEHLVGELGSPLQSAVSIQLGHAEGSRQLASRFANVFLQAYPGILLVSP